MLGFKANYRECNCSECGGQGWKLAYVEKSTGICGTLHVPHDANGDGLKELDRVRKFLYLRMLAKEDLLELLLNDKHGQEEDDIMALVVE